MSYDIYIGEATIEEPSAEEAAEGYASLSVGVSRIELSEAPSFPGDEMTKNGNHRHPGYGAWAEWCREVGLYELFFAQGRGLMSEHPGVVKLLPAHHDKIRSALAAYPRNANEPGWCVCRDCRGALGKDDVPHKDYDDTLARLIWLEWWVAWALKNCRIPAMENR